MAEPQNGRLVWWILSLLTTVVLAGGAGWVGSIQSQANTIAATQATRGERISALEQRVTFLESAILGINTKLDRLIEERRR